MTSVAFSEVIALLIACCAAYGQPVAQVNLIVIDPFGGQPTGCVVDNFVAEPWATTMSDIDAHDVAVKFIAMHGSDVGLGEYSAFVHCDHGLRASGRVEVSHPQALSILTATAQRGDNYNGSNQALSVEVSQDGPAPSKDVWIRAVSAFAGVNEIAIARSGSQAIFYNLLPARYLFIIMTGGEVSRIYQCDVTGRSGKLRLEDREVCKSLSKLPQR